MSVSDEQLLRELLNGNTAALENIVNRYHVPIYTYLYRLLGSPSQAEDLTQECFIRVIEYVRKGRLPDSFRPWIYKIAANLCRDLWRRPSYRYEWVNDEALGELPSDHSVASIFEKQSDREAVITAIGRLAPEKRNLIVLRFYQELKLEEIAGVLDIPLGTVKSRLYQCLTELERLLADRYGEEAGQSGRMNRQARTSGKGGYA